MKIQWLTKPLILFVLVSGLLLAACKGQAPSARPGATDSTPSDQADQGNNPQSTAEATARPDDDEDSQSDQDDNNESDQDDDAQSSEGDNAGSDENDSAEQAGDRAGCGNDPAEAPVALSRIVEASGASQEEVLSYWCAGYGLGEIKKAYRLSKLSSQSVAEIFAMRDQGMGWGQIRKALGLAPGNGNGGGNDHGNGNAGDGKNNDSSGDAKP